MSSSTSQSVVDTLFCSPEQVHLAFFEKSRWFKSDVLMVADINGNVIFQVKSRSWPSREVVYDSFSETPVISLEQKSFSFRDRWQVFAGDSSVSRKLLFSARKSSAFDRKTKLRVFLAGNDTEELCDFKIEGSYRKKKCTVYQGDSSTVVAQMSKKCEGATGSTSVPKRKHCFWMTVSPNVDYCFITALAVVLREHNRPSSMNDGGGSSASAMGAF